MLPSNTAKHVKKEQRQVNKKAQEIYKIGMSPKYSRYIGIAS